MRGMTSLALGAAVVVLSGLAGGLFGGRVLATQEAMPDHYDAFAAALAAVEENFVDEVETERLVYQAIGGMLQTLDPHSNFMDPRSYAQLRERQEGGTTGSASRSTSSTTGSPSSAYSRGRQRFGKGSVGATSSRVSAARTPRT